MTDGPLHDLRGEAVTIWRLARNEDELHCFVVEPPRGFWLGVERGHDLLLSETYPALDPALARAEILKAPLLADGWTDADVDVPLRRRMKP